ncbi:MAG: histidine phosphatase family protein [Caldilineaceae bacterium]|nr:histidine phosphatase family protein [Caldilineaceae bacterium]
MQTEFILIRHGETIWNVEGRFQGQQDSPLTPLGIAQAEAAAVHVCTYTPTALYSSDLTRTLQTAQPIALATGLTTIHEPALRERNLGIFEGLTHAEAEMRHGAEYMRFAAREPEYVLPAGESLAQLSQRGMGILATLAQRHPGERVAIVSHGALLTAILRHIQGIELHLPSPFTIHNGSISRVHYHDTPGAWSLITLGEVLHLDHITVAG